MHCPYRNEGEGEEMGASNRVSKSVWVLMSESLVISWSHEKNLKPWLYGPRRRAAHQL